jgi:site-specific DNA-methyltransferase (cytosine-N4-specific)
MEETPIGYVHGLHSYPARMHPPVAKKLIRLFAAPGDIVLDPFCGSGGVLTEAIIQRCNGVGIDINPLACLLSRVKTKPLNANILYSKWNALFSKINEILKLQEIVEIHKIVKEASQINYIKGKADCDSTVKKMVVAFDKINVKIPDFSNLNVFYWFKYRSAIELAVIKNCIEEIEEKDIREFFLVCFSSTVREVSGTRKGEFKLYRIPLEDWEIYNPETLKIFSKKVSINIAKMAEFFQLFSSSCDISSTLIIQSDSRKIFCNEFPEEGKKTLYTLSGDKIKGKVNLIVTSPPYGDSGTTVAYGQYSRYSSFWLGYNRDEYFHVDKKSLGGAMVNSDLLSPTLDSTLNAIRLSDEKRARVVKNFFVDFNECLQNFYKVLAPSSHACFVVGNRTVKSIQIPTDKIVVELGNPLGFRCSHTFSRKIPNKRMPSKNSPTNEKGKNGNTMDSETIVVLEKN